MSRTFCWALCLLVAVAGIGVAVLLYATAEGIGISPDSVIYIEAARNLAGASGLSYWQRSGGVGPMTHFPPLYPALLAGLDLCGLDPVFGAKGVSLCFFAANSLLIGVLLFFLTGGSIGISVLASALALASKALMSVHAMAWSEPPFLFLGFLGLALLAAHMARPRGWLLLVSVVAVALALLTRYAGIAFVAAGSLSLLLWRQGMWRHRIRDALLFLSASLLPMGLWMVRNLSVGGTATDRSLGFHPVGYPHLRAAKLTVSGWLLPRKVSSVASWIILLAAGVAVAVLAFLARRRKSAPGEAKADAWPLRYLPHALATFVCIYVPFLATSMSFLDVRTPFNDRTLSPVYVAGLLVILWLAHRAMPRGKPSLTRWVGVACLLVGAAWVVFQGAYASRWAGVAHLKGLGLASTVWKRSETLRLLRTLPPETRIYTNAVEPIRFWTGRRALLLPMKRELAGGGGYRENPEYPLLLGRMRKGLEESKGVLVLFRRSSVGGILPSEDELQRDLPLRLVTRASDGAIYELAP